MKGCFIASANFGELDYTSEDPTEVSLTLQFDNCVLTILRSKL